MMSKQVGKNAKPVGQTPAILLCNPKYAHNVGMAVRAASCFGLSQVWWTGDRVSLDPAKGRLPREERMKGYADVDMIQHDYPIDCFGMVAPVAVELSPSAELLPTFWHPENALYVFGPEDGSIPKAIRRHCHRHVVIPTRHCTNLAAAVYITLYDRLVKEQAAGRASVLPASEILDEDRGPAGALHDRNGVWTGNDR